MEMSARGFSSKLYQVLLVSAGSLTRYPTSQRVVLAHLGLYSGSASASTCTDSAFDYTDTVYESFESELSSEEESACACSSFMTGGGTKVSTCGY
jgi:hypothetical protein